MEALITPVFTPLSSIRFSAQVLLYCSRRFIFASTLARLRYAPAGVHTNFFGFGV